MIEKIYTPLAPDPVGPYSQAVRVGEFVYLSGQIPLDPDSGDMVDGSVVEQTRQVCENIRAVLAAANLSFDQVVKTTCFLIDMDDFGSFNSVYEEYFISEPARSCVGVGTLPKGARVEVEVIAHR